MSDIPETFMQAAWECEFPHSGQTRREAIARALMAAAREADEAATKRERERTGLTEQQFEGLANGTMVVVPNAEMERLLSELTMAREGYRAACEANRNLRAMLALKEKAE